MDVIKGFDLEDRDVVIIPPIPKPVGPFPADHQLSEQYTMNRNTWVGKHIGRILDMRLCAAGDATNETPYYIPPGPLDAEVAQELGIESADDMFGGVLEEREHADKAVFHRLVPGADASPGWYSSQFAQLVTEAGAVLPGYTVFSAKDAVAAMEQLQAAGYSVVRTKDPTAQASKGQHAVSNETELVQALGDLSAEKIADHGLVLEPNLENPFTFSVGQIQLGGHIYSYVGHQEETMRPWGEVGYGGTTLTMVRGGFDELGRLLCGSDPARAHVVSQAEIALKAFYQYYGLVASRINFDAVVGSANGQTLSGICDQSFRIGGASPAEMLAIQTLLDDPDVEQVTARMRGRWNPQYDRVTGDPGGWEWPPLEPGQQVVTQDVRFREIVEVLDTKRHAVARHIAQSTQSFAFQDQQ